MKQTSGPAVIFKTTWPNKKIYVGRDTANAISFFGASSEAANAAILLDFPTSESRSKITVVREVLWEGNETPSEVDARKRDWIEKLGANNPDLGYNQTPPFPGKSRT
jgi:hypothetical protein